MNAVLDLEGRLNDMLGDLSMVQEGVGGYIADLGKADWALRKIREQEARIAEIRAFEAQRKEEIAAWADGECDNYQRSINWLTNELEVFHRRQYELDPHLKTIKLPAGELKLRKAAPQYNRNDEEFLAWLEVNRPDLVKVEKKPNWGEAKKRFAVNGGKLIDEETGLVVEGVEVVEADGPKFRVKVSEEKSA